MVTPVKAKITAENAREAWSTAPEEMNDWPTRNDWKGVEDISEPGGVKQIPTAQPPPMSPQEASTLYEPQLDHFLPPLYLQADQGVMTTSMVWMYWLIIISSHLVS